MALLHTDSFDHYGTADLLTKWGSKVEGAGVVTIAGFGRNGTNGLRITTTATSSSGPAIVRSVGAASGPVAIAGFAFTPSVLSGATNVTLCTFLDGATEQVSINMGSTGAIIAKRGASSGGAVLGTSPNTLAAGSSVYIEAKVLIDAGIGTVEVRVNGSSGGWLNLTGLNTRNSAVAQWNGFAFGKPGGGVAAANGSIYDYDDLYLCDGSGPRNNDFLGDVRILAQLCLTGNGANVDFTPSTGTDHGALVDDATPIVTDYNFSSTVGHRDTYLFPPITLTGVAVRGVTTWMYAAKSDAGTRTLARVHRIAGANYDGTGLPVGTSYAYLGQVDEVSPATGVAFTTVEINGTETGMKIAS